MLKKSIGVLCLLINIQVFANFPDFDKALYQPLKEKKDISFEIQSLELTELINEKLLLKVPTDTFWKVYKLHDQEQVDLDKFKDTSESVKKVIQEGFLSKASFAWLDSMKTYLDSFKFLKREDSVYYYEEIDGSRGIEELRLSFSRGVLNVEMDLIDQTEKHQYIYDRMPWSGGSLVLISVYSQIKKFTDLTETKTDITYKKLSKKLWLPSKIKVVTTQNSHTKTVGKVERSLTELYQFRNYKIDQKFASDWFKSHNN